MYKMAMTRSQYQREVIAAMADLNHSSWQTDIPVLMRSFSDEILEFIISGGDAKDEIDFEQIWLNAALTEASERIILKD